MNNAHFDFPPGLSLCKRWLACYNEFLFLVMALRQLVRAQVPLGLIREQIRDRATNLTDLADQLLALGYRPDTQFAGDEAKLWAATTKFANEQPWQSPLQDTPFEHVLQDVGRMRDGCQRFEQFVAGLPDCFFVKLPALDPQFHRPERLLGLMGQRGKSSANGVRPDHVV